MARTWLNEALALASLAVLGSISACGSPELDGSHFACNSDADCLGSEVCGTVGGQRACIAASESPIRIGMSGPFQGPSAELGIEMRRGINAMFQALNADGGVHGRDIELVAENDNYDPDDAVAAVQTLLDIKESTPGNDEPDVRGPDGVFALLGSIGTPTMLRTAPLADKNEVVFFAPFTGAQTYLRDGTNSPYVYNYRAGYFEETQAMIDYLATDRLPRVISSPPGDSYKRIIVFQQDDSYGDSGYEGLVNAYQRVPDASLPGPTAIPRIVYQREQLASVDQPIEQAKEMLEALRQEANGPVSVAIVMIDTYQPANKFIRAIKTWLAEDATRKANLDVLFMNVSFVGSDSLSRALRIPEPPAGLSYTENVMVMQVVPYYGSQAQAIVDYRRDIDRFQVGEYTFTSLEGYVVAKLFAEALLMNGANLTTESFRTVLDSQVRDLDIGIGTSLNFSPSSRQASHTVWGSSIESDGSFSVPFIWDPTTHIRPN
jgi:ABC-type branched-subunit amino acid transport system substrate-binding protein